MTNSELIKEKVTQYFSMFPELKEQEISTMLIDFVIEKYKDKRHFPKSFAQSDIEKDIKEHISTIAMAVVDVFMKAGAEGQTTHSENGISRTYENAYISSSVFKDILPFVDVLK